MPNNQAYEMLTIIERITGRMETENKINTSYYNQVKSIENTIRESCPVLVKKWDDLQDLIKSVSTGQTTHTQVKQACADFDKWLDANE